MGLSTPPPTADPGVRLDLGSGAAPRPPADAAATAAAVRALVAELSIALPTAAPAPLETLVAAAVDPQAFAQAVLSWLGRPAAGRTITPQALADAIDHGFSRSLAGLARATPATALLGGARDVIRAVLAARAPIADGPAESVPAVRALVAELATVLPGMPAPAETLVASVGEPRAFANAMLVWLAPAVRSLPPAALADLIERGFAQALLSLARPAGPTGDALAAARDLIRITLAASVPAPRPPPITALRVLTEELRSAVVESLGNAEAPPLPAAEEDVGNVAAALVRWLGSSATASGLPLYALREVVALAFARTRDVLGPEAMLPAVEDVLERAREVLSGALVRPRGAPPATAPGYRPDLPLIVAGRSTRRVPRRPGMQGPRREEAEPEPRHEQPPPREVPPPKPDLKGPMELVRRYVEDLSEGLPGVAAQHFVYPAGVWDGRHWHGHADATLLSAQQERARAELTARGIATERVLLMRVEPVSDSVAIVHVRTVRESAAGAALGEEETAITTVRTPQGWRIAALLASSGAPDATGTGPAR